MADDESKKYLITPPPGLLPTPAKPEPSPAAEEPIPVITFPGVPTDSATRRITPAREPVPARRPPVAGIPFSTQAAAPPVAKPVETSAPPLTPPAAAPVVEPDNDETRIIVAGKHAAPTWRLALPDGQSVVVTTPIFIGRNPSRTKDDVDGALLPVTDDTKSVSKTHALIEPDENGLWVTDLDSTNGVFITSPTTDDIQVEPGERTLVPAGSDIELGEFVIQVEHG